jgi:hypothetical protein
MRISVLYPDAAVWSVEESGHGVYSLHVRGGGMMQLIKMSLPEAQRLLKELQALLPSEDEDS